MNHWNLKPLLTLALLAGLVLLLTGCGTTAINQQAMSAHHEALMSQRLAIEQHAGACATAAASCDEDLCRVATLLACNVNSPSLAVEQPRLRSPGEEFARGFGPVANLASAGLNIWGAGWLVDRSGRNAAELVNAVGGVVGQVQGPVDNSTNVGGNWGDTRGDAGDTIGGDRGGDTGGDRYHAGRDIRQDSPGPIDNSDSSDNSTNVPAPPGVDPDPDP